MFTFTIILLKNYLIKLFDLDEITIIYRGQVQFVDPITRQTYTHATTQNCSDRIKNLFQLDMDQEDSWYTLTPGVVIRTSLL